MKQQSERLTEALSNIIFKHPFFAVYLYDIMNIQEVDEMHPVKTAATDGRIIYVNTKWFDSLTAIGDRVFVLVHEILHGMFQHPERGKAYLDRGFGPDMLPYNQAKMNQAMDYVINALLVSSNVGTMPSGINQGLLNPKYTDGMLADDVYRDLPDPPEDPNGGHGGFDQHIDPDPNNPPPTDAQVKQAIQGALNAAKAMGKIPGALARMAGEILEHKVPWQQLLREYMQIIAGRSESSWNNTNRRKLVLPPHLVYPGTTGYGCDHVVLINDTSGSIGGAELTAYMSEVSGLLSECNPKRTTLLWVDSKVAGEVEIEDPMDLIGIKPMGGGGTDMTQGFLHIEEQCWVPDVVVVLTDGYTPYGEAPGFSVIWVTTGKTDMPYGQVVKLEV